MRIFAAYILSRLGLIKDNKGKSYEEAKKNSQPDIQRNALLRRVDLIIIVMLFPVGIPWVLWYNKWIKKNIEELKNPEKEIQTPLLPRWYFLVLFFWPIGVPYLAYRWLFKEPFLF